MNARIKRTYIPDHHNDWWFQRWSKYNNAIARIYWSIKDQEIKFI